MTYPRPVRAFFRLKHVLDRILRPWRYSIIFFYVVPYPVLAVRFLRLAGKRLIYNIDDPLFLPTQDTNGELVSPKLPERILFPILRNMSQVAVFSSHLEKLLRDVNPNTSILMPPVDASIYRPREDSQGTDRAVRIGWVGTHYQLRNLFHVAPVLERIKRRFREKVDLVYSCELPAESLSIMRWIPFDDFSEVEHYRNLDIAITPFLPDDYNRLKGSGKTLQYMAVGIPTVATRHGVNETLISHEETGFLCQTSEEWFSALTRLIENPDLRKSIGKNARDFILQHQDVRVWRPYFERFLLGQFSDFSTDSDE